MRENIHIVCWWARDPICLIPASAACTARADLLTPSAISWLSITYNNKQHYSQEHILCRSLKISQLMGKGCGLKKNYETDCLCCSDSSKCQWRCVRFAKCSVFLENPTRVWHQKWRVHATADRGHELIHLPQTLATLLESFTWITFYYLTRESNFITFFPQ